VGIVQGELQSKPSLATRVRSTSERVLATTSGRYGLAVGLALLALAVTLFLEDTLSSTLTIFFVAAIALSAWLCGFGPGLLATAISTLCLSYFFISPRREWHLDTPTIVTLAVFALVAILISLLNQHRQHAVAEQRVIANRAEEEIARRTRAEQELAAYEDRIRSVVESANADAFAASDARLAALLAQLPVGVGLTDNHGRWVLKNHMMDRFVGNSIPSHDPNARPRWQTWDDHGNPIPPTHWPGARALQGETVLGMDFLYTNDREEQGWSRNNAAPFYDASGNIVGAIYVVQDINARKKTEEALIASEAHARLLADASAILATAIEDAEALERVMQLAVPDIADWCVVDLLQPDGSLHRRAVVHADPSKALAARALLELHPAIPPDVHHTTWDVLRSGKPRFDPAVEPVRFVAEARDEVHLELLRQLGFASELLVPLMARGQAIGVLTLVYSTPDRQYGESDVPLAEELALHCALALDNERLYREARDAQAKISRLFDAGVIGLLVADPEHIVEANDRFLTMVGRTREELHAGRLCWAEMTPPEFAEMDASGIAELEEKGFCTPFEKEYIRPDGSRIPVLIGAAELQKNPPLWIGCVLDLTAQKQAEQDRLAFVDAATHDLKNPLAAMKAQTQLMLRRLRRGGEPDVASIDSSLTDIDGSITRMTNLIDEIIDAARLRAGQDLSLVVRPVDLVDIAERCVTSYQATSQIHELHLAASPQSIVGTWDEARLERVLSNLLANAIKYSPSDGPIVIQITTVEEPDGSDWAELSVQDFGIGIPTSDLSRIFDQFGRGSNVTGLVGSGIGLAASRRIVEQHGGTITVASEEGNGSTFTVRLPLQPVEAGTAIGESLP
jgi:PAS domain S-box-containing protein